MFTVASEFLFGASVASFFRFDRKNGTACSAILPVETTDSTSEPQWMPSWADGVPLVSVVWWIRHYVRASVQRVIKIGVHGMQHFLHVLCPFIKNMSTTNSV